MASERPFGPEGPECEWKERPPRPERLARTLAAFHNGAGGSLWVGVADDGSLVGVADLEAARGAVAEAQECCEPRPALQMSRRRVEGVLLLEVQVAPGQEVCRVHTPGGSCVAYVRDRDSSRRATDDQVKRLERGGAGASLDDRARRLLRTLAREGQLRRRDLARAMRAGERTCRRTLVPLLDAGLVQEGHDGFLSLTPKGHRRASP